LCVPVNVRAMRGRCEGNSSRAEEEEEEEEEEGDKEEEETMTTGRDGTF